MEDVGFAAWIFRGRVAATPRLQRGYSEGRYLGRPETDGTRCLAIGVIGSAFREFRPEEALQVLKSSLALRRRHFSHDEPAILSAQTNVACCLGNLRRHDEALVLAREIYAGKMALLGVSHENTIGSGCNLAASLTALRLWDEAKTFLHDQLLPVARRSLGADHDLTLRLNQNLAAALDLDPKRTRDDLRLNRHRSVL